MTQLELQIKTCNHLQLKANRKEAEDWVEIVGKRGEGLSKSHLNGEIKNLRPEEVICDITGEACVLYQRKSGVGTMFYNSMPRCPVSRMIDKTYNFSGVVNARTFPNPNFFIQKIEEKKIK